MEKMGCACKSGVSASIYYFCLTHAIKKMHHIQYVRDGASIAAKVLIFSESASESKKDPEKYSLVCINLLQTNTVGVSQLPAVKTKKTVFYFLTCFSNSKTTDRTTESNEEEEVSDDLYHSYCLSATFN